MTLRPWIYAQDRILTKVRDCPWALAEMAFKEAAREFFHDTRAWMFFEDALFTIADLPDYALDTGSRTEVVTIISCRVGRTDHSGVNEVDYRSIVTEGDRMDCASHFGGALWINPTPKTDGIQIQAQLALKPLIEASGMPIEQWKWFDFILPGILKNIHSIPERPYTSAAEAARQTQEFMLKKAKARSMTSRGGFSRQRVMPHPF